ncbi:archaeal flagellin FlaB [Nanobdella aerobiophila]|uniref:Archaeal flagellin FlaB n=1 Tax=Nanobdella aerobiophila TaxID=2586965 RepID=A0A915SKF5_9ARCH|nr:archaellin/type IV pilin N-terminal domain-containing protein [Nanobdella aerobiophila]BBL45608.1 archaeal flagellin FlaB [Nanobdella aerobiophila]
MAKGQFGLSTLIILIAIIVTAAVAAGVVIYTASALQAKALQTGQQAESRITTGMQITQMFGYQYNPNTGQLDNYLQEITGMGPVVSLMPGSGPINLEEVDSLLTTSNGNVYSYSPSNYEPTSIYGVLEGGSILISGFMYNDQVNVENVTINNTNICNTLTNISNQYIYINFSYINNTLSSCSININSSVIGVPLSISQVFQFLQSMNEAGIQDPYAVIGLAVNQESVYLTTGENYELIYYIPSGLVTDENYNLQITPVNGYAAQYGGAIPTVLADSVVSLGGS